jgi:phosphopantothenoylcysteine decarboxylase/phosphopantothenate--cysteine ligase
MLKNKKIVLGITGCIAAYKSCEIIRLLQKQGAIVRVVATDAALKFITKLTLETLSKHKVYDDLFEDGLNRDVEHISLARWADLVLIAPVTANTLAKLTHGIADNLLTTICLATKATIILAPAMNYVMWENIVTQENLKQLVARGVEILEPASGEQACGEVGVGKMMDPAVCVKRLVKLCAPSPLVGKTIVITAGPTREPLDPVRFLSNQSSGKMGYALAKSAFNLGLRVTLISGPTTIVPPAGVETVFVETAQQMHNAVMSAVKDTDIFMSVAAVADYKAEVQEQKIKKNCANLSLSLQKTQDILKQVALLPHHPFTVGFAAETENIEQNALKKLTEKKLDMVIANEVGEGKAFNQDENALVVMTKNKKRHALSKKAKSLLAYEVFDILAQELLSSPIQLQHAEEAGCNTAK